MRLFFVFIHSLWPSCSFAFPSTAALRRLVPRLLTHAHCSCLVAKFHKDFEKPQGLQESKGGNMTVLEQRLMETIIATLPRIADELERLGDLLEKRTEEKEGDDGKGTN